MDTPENVHKTNHVRTSDDLLMVEDNQRLYYGNQPIHLHWLDKVSLQMISLAYSKKQSLALCYPTPVCNLPVLAAAQLIIQDFTINYPGNLSILLISPRIEVRQHYLNLKIGGEFLASVFPLARIRANGEPEIVDVRRRIVTREPRLYHLSQPRLLEAKWPKKIDVIILDHFSGNFSEEIKYIHDKAKRQSVRCIIHLCTDPFAPFLEELDSLGVHLWIWNHYGLTIDQYKLSTQESDVVANPFGISTHQFRNIARGIRHHILVCKHPKFQSAAQRVWDDLRTIQSSIHEHRPDNIGIHRAIRVAYGTFYTMLHMLVPLPVYEEEARYSWGIRPVSRRIGDLEAFKMLLENDYPDLAEIFWPSMILDLKEMRESLLAGNPKYETIIQQINDHIRNKKSLTVVCPNEATRRMLQLCLRAKEGIQINKLIRGNTDEQLIRLATYKDLNSLICSDILLFPGQFSYGLRQYALTAAASEIRYLAYSDEADRIEQQIAGIHKILSQLATGDVERKSIWIAQIKSNPNINLPEFFTNASEGSIEFIRSEGKKTSYRAVTADKIPDLSLWTPFSNIDYDLIQGQNTLTSENEEALRPSEFASSERQSVLVSALRIEFEDGFCYAEPDSNMTIFLPSTAKTDDRKVESLRPNDIVVFVDGDQKRRLYEAILERVERHPAMGTTYILVRYWQQSVRDGFFRSGMTYDEFLTKLQRLGSLMQTAQGVRFWVMGEVLGPSDAEDIRRVGEIFGDEALLQEWKNINRSLKRIRSIHVSLARNLNQMIIQAGLKGQYSRNTDECIDQELNLYLDDFRDSVALHRISSVDQEKVQVPYTLIGTFFKHERDRR